MNIILLFWFKSAVITKVKYTTIVDNNVMKILTMGGSKL